MGETDESGRRRVDDPEDWVRIEIETALKRDIPVIPLLVDGASFPREEDLPPSLQKLIYRHGMPVRPDPDFRHDTGRLIKALRDEEEERRRRESQQRRDRETRVIEIVSEGMGLAKNQVTRETSFVRGADPIDVQIMMMKFEDEFDITIPDEEAEKIQTVGQAIQYI